MFIREELVLSIYLHTNTKACHSVNLLIPTMENGMPSINFLLPNQNTASVHSQAHTLGSILMTGDIELEVQVEILST